MGFLFNKILFHTNLSVIVDCVPLIGALGKESSFYPICILLFLQGSPQMRCPHT